MASKNTQKLSVQVSSDGLGKVLTGVDRLKQRIDQINSKPIDSRTSMGLAAYAAAAKEANHGMAGLAVTGDRYDKVAKGVSESTSNGTKAFAKQAQGLGGLVHVYATFAANMFAVSAAFSVLKENAAIDKLIESQKILSKQSGIALGTMSRGIAEATGGALSLAEASKAASASVAAGFDTTYMERLTKVASGASKALGRDLSDSVRRLTQGIAKLEPEILDELGIFVKLEEATKLYALQVGKSVNDLTEFERRQAFANLALQKGEKNFAALSDTVDPVTYDKLAASFSDLSHSFLSVVNTPILGFLEYLLDNTYALGGVLAILGARLSRLAIGPLGALQEELAKSADKAAALAVAKKKLADQSTAAAAAAKQAVGRNAYANFEDSFKEGDIKFPNMTGLAKNMQKSTLEGAAYMKEFGDKFKKEVQTAVNEAGKLGKATQGMFKGMKRSEIASALEGIASIDKATGKVSLDIQTMGIASRTAFEKMSVEAKAASASVTASYRSFAKDNAVARSAVANMSLEYSKMRNAGVGAFTAVKMSMASLNAGLTGVNIGTRLLAQSFGVLASAGRLVGAAFNVMLGPWGIAITLLLSFTEEIKGALQSMGFFAAGASDLTDSVKELGESNEAASKLVGSLSDLSKLDFTELSAAVLGLKNNMDQAKKAIEDTYTKIVGLKVADGFIAQLFGATGKEDLVASYLEVQKTLKNTFEIAKSSGDVEAIAKSEAAMKRFEEATNAAFRQRKALTDVSQAKTEVENAEALKAALLSVAGYIADANVATNDSIQDTNTSIANLKENINSLNESTTKYLKSLEGSTKLDGIVSNVSSTIATLRKNFLEEDELGNFTLVGGNIRESGFQEFLEELKESDFSKLLDMDKVSEGVISAAEELEKFRTKYQNLAQQIKDEKAAISKRATDVGLRKGDLDIAAKALDLSVKRGEITKEYAAIAKSVVSAEKEDISITQQLADLESQKNIELAKVLPLSDKEHERRTAIEASYTRQIDQLKETQKLNRDLNEQETKNLEAVEAARLVRLADTLALTKATNLSDEYLNSQKMALDAQKTRMSLYRPLTAFEAQMADSASERLDSDKEITKVVQDIMNSKSLLTEMEAAQGKYSEDQKIAEKENLRSLQEQLKALGISRVELEKILEIKEKLAGTESFGVDVAGLLTGLDQVFGKFNTTFSSILQAGSSIFTNLGDIQSSFTNLMGNETGQGFSLSNISSAASAMGPAIGAGLALAGELTKSDDDPVAMAKAITDSFNKSGIRDQRDLETNALTGSIKDLTDVDSKLVVGVSELKLSINELNLAFSRNASSLSRAFGNFGEEFAKERFGSSFGTSKSNGFLGFGSSSTTRELLASGVSVSGSISSAQDIPKGIIRDIGEVLSIDLGNTLLFSIEQITKTKSGVLGIGSGTKSKIRRKTTGLGFALTTSLEETLEQALDASFKLLSQIDYDNADWISYLVSSIQNTVDSAVVDDLLDSVDLNLKDKSSTEISETLASYFNLLSDTIISEAVPEFAKFQMAGEELGDTLARLVKNSILFEELLRSSFDVSIYKIPIEGIEDAVRDRMIGVNSAVATSIGSFYDNIIGHFNDLFSGTPIIANYMDETYTEYDGEGSPNGTITHRVTAPPVELNINPDTLQRAFDITVEGAIDWRDIAEWKDRYRAAFGVFKEAGIIPEHVELSAYEMGENLGEAHESGFEKLHNVIKNTTDEWYDLTSEYVEAVKNFTIDASLEFQNTSTTLFGSFDKFLESMQFFVNGMYTEEERATRLMENLGQVLPTAMDRLDNSQKEFANLWTGGAAEDFEQGLADIAASLNGTAEGGRITAADAKVQFRQLYESVGRAGLFAEDLYDGTTSLGAEFNALAVNFGSFIIQMEEAEATAQAAEDALGEFLQDFYDRVTTFGKSDLTNSIVDLIREFEDLEAQARELEASEGVIRQVRAQGLREAKALVDELFSELTASIAGFRSSTVAAIDDIVVARVEYEKSLKGIASGIDTFVSFLPDAKNLKIIKATRELNKSKQAYQDFITEAGSLDTLTTMDQVNEAVSLLNGIRDNTIERYNAEADALKSYNDQNIQVLNTLKNVFDSLQDYIDSLDVGEFATGSKTDKLNESRSRFDELLARARGAGTVEERTAAAAELSTLANNFLTLSKDYYAGTGQYVNDFEAVKSALQEVQSVVGATAVSTEEEILNTLVDLREIENELNNDLTTVMAESRDIGRSMFDEIANLTNYITTGTLSQELGDLLEGFAVEIDSSGSIIEAIAAYSAEQGSKLEEAFGDEGSFIKLFTDGSTLINALMAGGPIATQLESLLLALSAEGQLESSLQSIFESLSGGSTLATALTDLIGEFDENSTVPGILSSLSSSLAENGTVDKALSDVITSLGNAGVLSSAIGSVVSGLQSGSNLLTELENIKTEYGATVPGIGAAVDAAVGSLGTDIAAYNGTLATTLSPTGPLATLLDDTLNNGGTVPEIIQKVVDGLGSESLLDTRLVDLENALGRGGALVAELTGAQDLLDVAGPVATGLRDVDATLSSDGDLYNSIADLSDATFDGNDLLSRRIQNDTAYARSYYSDSLNLLRGIYAEGRLTKGYSAAISRTLGTGSSNVLHELLNVNYHIQGRYPSMLTEIRTFTRDTAAHTGAVKYEVTKQSHFMLDSEPTIFRQIREAVNSLASNFSTASSAAGIDGITQFAKGGITNQPAIFGEAGPEAAVPLPDGRSIPVSFGTRIGETMREINKELVDALNTQTRLAQEAAQRLEEVLAEGNRLQREKIQKDARQAKLQASAGTRL